MRVFKWLPEFDAYCESPIAAIWCNLIGLPIHLFDQSALFAIGKLLGTPIQIDRATANKTRLSFARICIEIDITRPPPEEIILDICGREVVLQVKWDKIPSYCGECKHVGHRSEVCYAAKLSERPPKRNYNVAPPKQPQQGERGTKSTTVEPRQNESNTKWQQQGNNKAKESQPSTSSKASGGNGPGGLGPNIMGDMPGEHGSEMIPYHNKKDRYGPQIHNQPRGSLGRASSLERGWEGAMLGKLKDGHEGTSLAGERGRLSGSYRHFDLEKAEAKERESLMSSNRYYSLMADETFVDHYDGEQEVWEMNTAHFEEVDEANPNLMEAEPCQKGNDLQVIAFQGGPSHPLGSKLQREDMVFVEEGADFEVVDDSDQILHGKYLCPRLPCSIMVSAVYTKCTRGERVALWDKMREISINTEGMPWIIGEDFNTILSTRDRAGSDTNRQTEMIDFAEAIEDCRLLDPGYDGSDFTWAKNGFFERLDRVLVNEQWARIFEAVRATNLPRVASDHGPVLVRCKLPLSKYVDPP
ncbi:uncharacterized protein LOC121776240 [Salvia splendens]|uniref:uncharacterized protein LOC121776240 n=1 Tax=Salvia splendens TaxID=180675 RepID=UPI001C269E97|nr:uncharacterized protein LOC121776240 [Salvia splendens]